MDWGTVFNYIKEGGVLARREGWNGKGLAIEVYPAGANVQPYFVMKKPDGTIQPGWVPSVGDLFAQDWGIISQHHA